MEVGILAAAVKDVRDENRKVGSRPAEGMGGLAKGLAIIEAFSDRPVQSVADAARASGATRASARRCLLTLLELGYVERVGREFQPAERLLNLGKVSSKTERLARLSHPLLELARDELNESVSLAILQGGFTLFVARAEAAHLVSTGVRIGAHLPVYCSATGRVFLAQMTDVEVLRLIGRAPLVQRSPRTITDPHEVVNKVKEVRRDGFAISDEELELGMRSLAVPVFDAEGRLLAALSASASSGRIRVSDLRRRFVPVLQRTSEAITRAIA
jgi:IclR family transcriptional regulator, pca regulon regulatory protein